MLGEINSTSTNPGFMLYFNFILHILTFYIPATLGVLCAIHIRQFKTKSRKKLTGKNLFKHAIVWASPVATIVCIIDLAFAKNATETLRMSIFGSTFFFGMVGEEISSMLTHLFIWIKICKEILKDLGAAFGKVNFGEVVSNVLEEELDKDPDKKKEEEKENKDKSEKSDVDPNKE